jgi:hypothetical protein
MWWLLGYIRSESTITEAADLPIIPAQNDDDDDDGSRNRSALRKPVPPEIHMT